MRSSKKLTDYLAHLIYIVEQQWKTYPREDMLETRQTWFGEADWFGLARGALSSGVLLVGEGEGAWPGPPTFTFIAG
jgi:hypothetical protein